MKLPQMAMLCAIAIVSMGAYAVQQAAKPPVMSHDAAGREQCTMCHTSGMAGIPQAPESHAERTVETCAWCHAADADMQTATPKTIPHDLAGREQCGMCHTSGMAGIPQAPASHEGRDAKWCTMCHTTG